MKRNNLLIVAMIATLFGLTTACNNFDDSEATTLSLTLNVQDTHVGDRAKAILTLGEKDFTEKAFTVTYTVDGGQALIRRFSANEYFDSSFNWKSDRGSDGNFQSGSRMWVGLRVNHVPTVYLLMPEVGAGTHQVTITLTNVYGVTSTVTSNWNVM